MLQKACPTHQHRSTGATSHAQHDVLVPCPLLQATRLLHLPTHSAAALLAAKAVRGSCRPHTTSAAAAPLAPAAACTHQALPRIRHQHSAAIKPARRSRQTCSCSSAATKHDRRSSLQLISWLSGAVIWCCCGLVGAAARQSPVLLGADSCASKRWPHCTAPSRQPLQLALLAPAPRLHSTGSNPAQGKPCQVRQCRKTNQYTRSSLPLFSL